MAIQSVCFIVDYKTINETTPAYYWVESSIRSTLSIWSLNNLDAVSNTVQQIQASKVTLNEVISNFMGADSLQLGRAPACSKRSCYTERSRCNQDYQPENS